VNLDHLQQAITPSLEKMVKHGVASVRQRVRNLRDIKDLGPIAVFRQRIEEQIERSLAQCERI
jgi:lipoate-protein ligase A